MQNSQKQWWHFRGQWFYNSYDAITKSSIRNDNVALLLTNNQTNILDNKAAKKTDDITDIDGFSFNVAWSFEGDNKRKAESKMDNLDSESGYKIDYSNL